MFNYSKGSSNRGIWRDLGRPLKVGPIRVFCDSHRSQSVTLLLREWVTKRKSEPLQSQRFFSLALSLLKVFSVLSGKGSKTLFFFLVVKCMMFLLLHFLTLFSAGIKHFCSSFEFSRSFGGSSLIVFGFSTWFLSCLSVDSFWILQL